MKKTGDETVDSMFDEEVETRIAPDGKVEVMLVSPSAEEMEEAQAAFLVAQRKFRALEGDPEAVTDKLKNLRWWNALEVLYECDHRLWELFCGPDRSPRSNAQYSAYRERLVGGKRLYRTNA